GKFEVAGNKVRFKLPLADDEIDLESGFLMLPRAIPQHVQLIGPDTPIQDGGSLQPSPGTGGAPTPLGTAPSIQPVSPKPALDKTVELTFNADRNQLFTAWNAIANLADLAGNVKVTIRA